MSTPAPARPREVFLDSVRTVAIVRVVLWHALGAAVLTYFVAAVPAMFFVTGSLLAQSLRKGARVVILDRARRILLPLWFFATAAFVTMFVAHRIDGTAKTAVPWRDLVFWILPLDDPHGSKWEGGYMSSPLWYLRALLWLIILSPVLLRLVRRSRFAAFGIVVVGLAVLEWLARSGRWYSPWSWRLGDLFLYAGFLMAGFCHRDGRFDTMTRRHWLYAALGFGAGATLWCTTQMAADHVVNDSHPAHLLVGATWLCLMFAARPWIERFARLHLVGRFIAFVNQRSITIYLWHSTAIIVSYELLRRAGLHWFPGGWVIALLALTAVITLVFVLATGWIEDYANRRTLRAWPGHPSTKRPGRRFSLPIPALAFATVGSLLLVAAADETAFAGHRAEASASPPTTLEVTGDPGQAAPATVPIVTTTAAGPGLRVPSQQPKAPVFATTPTTLVPPTVSTALPVATAAATPTTDPPAPAPTTTSAAVATTVPAATAGGAPSAATAAKLQATFAAWLTANNVTGGEVAVVTPTMSWSGAVGTNPNGAANTVDTTFDIASITKTFTATLVWQAVDQGLIKIDDPIPQLTAVPGFPYAGKITYRQLLAHRSGLVNYRDTPTYVANPKSIDTPAKAVADVGTQPLEFTPGTKTVYVSTNYLVLGLLLEQVTGKSYDTLLSALEAQVGLPPIPHSPPGPGLPNFSTAGVTPTALELADWGAALLRDDAPGLALPDLAAMLTLDPTSTIGEGVWGYCPCTVDAKGADHWTAYGHGGASTQLEYAPADRTSIAVNIDDSIYVPDNRQDNLNQLFIDLGAIADAG